MSRIVTVQYALNPNEEQAQALSSHSGGARFAYNYVLGKVYENWEQVRNGETEEYLKITLPAMRRLFNQEKDTIAPWWRENGKNAYDTGITNAVSAFQRYFSKKSELPRYKRKVLEDRVSIDITTNKRELSSDKRFFDITRIGRVRLHERATKLAYLLRHGGKVSNVNLKYQRSRWFVTVTVQVGDVLWERYHLLRSKKDKKRIVGIDLGITKAAVYSDGTVIENPRSYEKQLKKLRGLNKELSRRQKYNKKTGELASKRYEKTRKKINKTHAKISNQERDFAHKTSKHLVDTYQIIGLEDLNVVGMLKNRRLARRIAHASFARLRSYVTYKSEYYGSQTVIIPRFYPSSKTCSNCGKVKAKLPLNNRTYKCDDCGLVIDRDLNASINIKNKAAQSCGEALNDHGDESAGSTRITLPSETTSQRNDKSHTISDSV